MTSSSSKLRAHDVTIEKKNMVFRGEISVQQAAKAALYYEESLLTVKEIAKKLQISRSSVYRLKNRQGNTKKKKLKSGRKKKIGERGMRRVKRSLLKLRETEGNFTIKTIAADFVDHPGTAVSTDTIRRHLNKSGYRHLVARRKGVITLKDKKERLSFAKKMRNKTTHYWKQNIAFYLDAVSFVYKTRPYRDARTPKGKVWRRRDEGLAHNCTSKGAHVGSGGKVLHIIVAISHDRGVVCCEPYEKMNGPYFSSFVRNNFQTIFHKASKRSKVFLQDGDPSQNSAGAKRAMKKLNAKILSIPPRSPDLNPIENLFGLTKKQLRKQAIEQRIEYETFESFTERVKSTICHSEIALVNSLIESMPKRIKEIIKSKGRRVNY